jgi:hypothetical protein
VIYIKKLKEKAKQTVAEYIGDFFILSGLMIIIVTTFLINTIAGLYVTGGIIFLLGVYFAFNLSRRG